MGLLIKANQKSQTKDLGLGGSVMSGESVRHPTTPIKDEEIRYFGIFIFEKVWQKIYIYIYILWVSEDR